MRLLVAGLLISIAVLAYALWDARQTEAKLTRLYLDAEQNTLRVTEEWHKSMHELDGCRDWMRIYGATQPGSGPERTP